MDSIDPEDRASLEAKLAKVPKPYQKGLYPLWNPSDLASE
jgi:hypothetical protein